MRTLVVGLGHQSVEDHIPALQASPHFAIQGVVDLDGQLAQAVGDRLGVPFSTDVSSLMEQLSPTPQVAVVALPHSQYLPVLRVLAEAGIHVIKEKPFATSVAEAIQISRLVQSSGIVLRLTLQRRFNPIYLAYRQLLGHIGRVHTVEARYVMNVRRLDEGWRASQLDAGGGALVDLGYHFVDLIVWLFGLPSSVYCQIAGHNRPDQDYDTEDTAIVIFDYGVDGPDGLPHGTLVTSRVYPSREEELTAYGTGGCARVQRGACTRIDTEGNVVESLRREDGWPSALIDQLASFATDIRSQGSISTIPMAYLQQVAFIDASYRSARNYSPASPLESLEEILDGSAI